MSYRVLRTYKKPVHKNKLFFDVKEYNDQSGEEFLYTIYYKDNQFYWYPSGNTIDDSLLIKILDTILDELKTEKK